MAASETSQTTTTTASTCTPVTARGTHMLTVAGQSLHKGLGAGRSVRSATFAVGGYQWSILYYPDGSTSTVHADRLVVYLELMSKRAEVRAHFDFRLVEQATGKATLIHRKPMPAVLFSTIDADDAGGAGNNKCSSWGTFSIRKASEFEASSYLLDDRLIIQCNVIVIGDPRVEETAAAMPGFEVRVPAPDLSDNLGKLLAGKKGEDVTFRVRDELFQAHKVVLAARSPVFDAEFFGPMAEDTAARPYLTIEDMHPDVFRALLHFVYTDSMPSLEGFDASDSREMVRHLLVAADRYAMERLKLICEGILCSSLVAEDVATSLALADMHNCHHLRNACIALTSSLDKTDNNDDVARQEYTHPKIAFPTVLLDVLDNMRKWMFSCL